MYSTVFYIWKVKWMFLILLFHVDSDCTLSHTEWRCSWRVCVCVCAGGVWRPSWRPSSLHLGSAAQSVLLHHHRRGLQRTRVTRVTLRSCFSHVLIQTNSECSIFFSMHLLFLCAIKLHPNKEKWLKYIDEPNCGTDVFLHYHEHTLNFKHSQHRM